MASLFFIAAVLGPESSLYCNFGHLLLLQQVRYRTVGDLSCALKATSRLTLQMSIPCTREPQEEYSLLTQLDMECKSSQTTAPAGHGFLYIKNVCFVCTCNMDYHGGMQLSIINRRLRPQPTTIFALNFIGPQRPAFGKTAFHKKAPDSPWVLLRAIIKLLVTVPFSLIISCCNRQQVTLKAPPIPNNINFHRSCAALHAAASSD